MNQPAKSNEPSMEEILASIRRIIADDDAKPAVSSISSPAAFQPEPVAPPPPVLRPVATEPAPKSAPLPVELLQDIPPAPRPVAPPEPVVSSPIIEETADILELTEDMRAPEPPAPIPFRSVDPQRDVIFSEPEPELESIVQPEESYAAVVADRPQQPAFDTLDNPLLSNIASAAVDSAFSSLAHTVLSRNARTLDDLVKDMLRPMLKSWLDDNLPSLVERLVRAEIERVSRGR